MTLIFTTKKINIHRYYEAVKRCIMLNAADRTRRKGRFGRTILKKRRGALSSHEVWSLFKREVTTHILPLSEMGKYTDMFKHLNIDPNGKMAWGFTGKNEWYWFVTDSRDPRIFMQNLGPGFHECLHMMYQLVVGTGHIDYKRIEPPEVGRLPQSGPAATVIVHDNWYGFKTKVRVWFWVGIFVPVAMPYIPIEKAREMYSLTYGMDSLRDIEEPEK